MSTLNFQIISSPLTILTTTSTTTILPQNSKLVICSDELILKLKLKLDDSQEDFFNSNLLFDSPFLDFFRDYLRKRMIELKIGNLIDSKVVQDEIHLILNPSLTSTSLLLSSEISIKLSTLNLLILFTITPQTSLEESQSSIILNKISTSQILDSPLHPNLSTLISNSLNLWLNQLIKRFPVGFDYDWIEKLNKDRDFHGGISDSILGILDGSDDVELKNQFQGLKEKMKIFLHPRTHSNDQSIIQEANISQDTTREDINSIILLSTRNSPALSKPSKSSTSKLSFSNLKNDLEIEEDDEPGSDQENPLTQKVLGDELEEEDQDFEDLDMDRLPSVNHLKERESQREFFMDEDDLFGDLAGFEEEDAAKNLKANEVEKELDDEMID